MEANQSLEDYLYSIVKKNCEKLATKNLEYMHFSNDSKHECKMDSFLKSIQQVDSCYELWATLIKGGDSLTMDDAKIAQWKKGSSQLLHNLKVFTRI